MPKWLLFPKHLILFFSSISGFLFFFCFLWPNHFFAIGHTFVKITVELSDRSLVTRDCLIFSLFLSWLLTTLCSLSWLSFLLAMCLLRRSNQLEEKSKGVVDRSSTVIAKEPEGTCLISFWLLIYASCFFFKSFSFTTHTEKKNTHTNKKAEKSHTHKRRQKTFVGLGVLFFSFVFLFDLIRLSNLYPPTNDWNNSRRRKESVQNGLIYWKQ